MTAAAPHPTLTVRCSDALAPIDRQHWNALVRHNNPFLRHEFLTALEHHGAVDPRYGWWPRHLLAYDGERLVGAAPQYVKNNTYGEFVFDWAWADAYQRHGFNYYPKLVVAVPYTPAQGQRMLIHPHADRAAVANALIRHALDDARAHGLSSSHWLFVDDQDRADLARHGLFERTGLQFHWHNPGYADFDQFLGELSAKKRKNILRERRRVHAAGIRFEWRHGDDMQPRHWQALHAFYRATFLRKGGQAVLSQDFFATLGRSMPSRIIVVLARRAQQYIAGALLLRSDHTLYGRYWGALEAHDGLHFETCYYQGLTYAIGEGLHAFEPGAQGEFKLSRGFLPTKTYSMHWLAHPEFRRAIARHTADERHGVTDYMAGLAAHSPYRQPHREQP